MIHSLCVLLSLVALIAATRDGLFDSVFQSALDELKGIEKRDVDQCKIDCATQASTCSPCNKKTVADFVLAIDTSSSMQDNIDAVNAGMQSFVAAISKRDIEAYFLVLLYGVEPEVLVDWTQDGNKVQHVLSGVNAGGPCINCKQPDVTHFNHDCTGCSTREAPFEPILMTLGVAGPNGGGRQEIKRNPANKKYAPGTGPIKFHPDSRKFFIILTDEDADCPAYPENRFPTPSGAVPKCIEPQKPFPTSKTGGAADIWIDEIDYTVKKVIEADASVHIFSNRGNGASINQYGDPVLQQQNGDFSNFNEQATLARLLSNSKTKFSFQSKAIQAKTATNIATYRVFDVSLVTKNNGKNVENFFNQVVEAVDAGCFLRKRQANKVPCNKYECHCSGCKTIPLCNEGCHQCKIGGKCYAAFEKNPANQCQQCLPDKSKTQWSGCDDNNSCTDDKCTNGQCVYTPRCTKECNLCTIDGACVPFKSYKQAGIEGTDCYWCLPDCSDTQWTPTGFCKGIDVPPSCGGPIVKPPAPETCDDAVKNQDETGVDCGGTKCPPCQVQRVGTCTDGVKNGPEQGVDCDGDCPVPCGGTCMDGIRQPSEQCLDCGGRCPNQCTQNQLANCNSNQQPMQQNDGMPTGTCMDQMQNVGEQGVDCGGRCPTACTPPATGYPGTCADGLQNFGEIGVDCGGRCFLLGGRKCSFEAGGMTGGAMATCMDKVQNGGEEGVDCGGPCPNQCANCSFQQFQMCSTMCGAKPVINCQCSVGQAAPTSVCEGDANPQMMSGGGMSEGSCFDQLQNGNEEGVDCGGRCAVPCSEDKKSVACSTEQSQTCFSVCDPNPVKQCQCTADGNSNVVCGQPVQEMPTTAASLCSLSLLTVVSTVLATVMM